MPGPVRLRPLPAALATLCLVLSGRGVAQHPPSPKPLEARFELRTFEVEAVVPASGAALSPAELRHARRWRGASALFNADPTAKEGRSVITHGVPDRGEPGATHTSLCGDWRLRPLDRPPPRDPAIADALARDEVEDGRWATLTCGGRAAREMFVLPDPARGYLTRVLDDRVWLVWRPPSPPAGAGDR